VIGLALILYNLVVWAEFTLVDDRGRVAPTARRAMSSALCPVMASRPYVPLAFDRLVYRVRSPRRGEVVGFVPSGWTDSVASVLVRDHRRFLGRVVGVPGDEVEVRKGQLYLNGRLVEESYREGRGGIDVGPTRLLADQYFVLGDNRDVPLAEYHGGLVAGRDLRGRLTEVGRLRLAYLVEASRC
jgi:signal peptidase I